MEFGTPVVLLFFFFFFNDTATTEIYTLSLHDALPISPAGPIVAKGASACYARANRRPGQTTGIRICQAMSAGSGGRGCVDRIDAMSSDAAQDRPTPQDLTPPASAAAFAAGSAQSSPAADLRSGSSALVLGVGAVAVAALIACGMLWQRLGNIQEQLARQSAQSGSQSVEARTLARDAQ